MGWIYVVVRAHPAVFRPLKRIVALVLIDCADRGVAEFYDALLNRLIVEGIDKRSIALLHLPIRLIETYQISQMWVCMCIFPNGYRVFDGRRSRRFLASG